MTKQSHNSLTRVKSMFYRILGFLLLLIVIIPVYADTNNTQQIDDPCLIPKSETLTRPDFDGEPIEISVGIFIVDIIELNELNGSFKLDLTVDIRWQDSRLSSAARSAPLTNCHILLDQIWHPDIEAINTRSPVHT